LGGGLVLGETGAVDVGVCFCVMFLLSLGWPLLLLLLLLLLSEATGADVDRLINFIGDIKLGNNPPVETAEAATTSSVLAKDADG